MRRLLLIDDQTASVSAATNDATIAAIALITRSDRAEKHSLPPGTTLICPISCIRGTVWRDRRIDRRVVYGDSNDMERALLLGADDYLCEPWRTPELLARARRSGAFNRSSHGNVIEVGDVTVVVSSQQAALWRVLAERKGRTVSRDVLREIVRREAAPIVDTLTDRDDRRISRAIDMHIARLRRSLGEHGACIETVRGCGYRLRGEILKTSNLTVDKSWKT